MTQVIMLNGQIENNGWVWDSQPYNVEVIGNPFPGPMEAPEGWDFQITYEEHHANPLPEGATFEDVETFIDSAGTMRLESERAQFDLITQVAAARDELAGLTLLVNLGRATAAQKARTVELLDFLDANSNL
jgi:hypothetical protein